MRSVRGRVEISTSFIHLAFYSKLQPDVTGVSQCARVMVRMCAQVRWSSSWRERHWKSCGYMFYFIFAPFFWSQEKFIHPFPRWSKISTTALKSLPVRSSRAAAVSLLRARWGLLSYSPQEKQPRLLRHALSPHPWCVLSSAAFFPHYICSKNKC